METKEIIKHNRDFLFIYEAIKNNPNGDPDQENKPRMDYDTHTNLVTDVRLKRFIRDYLKRKNKEVFVSLEDGSKVSMNTKLKNYLDKNLLNDIDKIFKNNEEAKEKIKDILKEKKPSEVLVKKLQSNKEDKEIINLNKQILTYYIANDFIDIRMFGSAFAVDGFTFPITGAIQINWGYSLNNVFFLDSDTITPIMSDEYSTFGKDYRIKYSLLSFLGTINEEAAKTTFLTNDDLEYFREATWFGIHANPTRTKPNQFPLLYLEIEYKDNIPNGMLGDLRQYIDVTPKVDDKKVEKYEDLNVDFSKLIDKLKKNSKIIQKIHYYKNEKEKIVGFENLDNVKELNLIQKLFEK